MSFRGLIDDISYRYGMFPYQFSTDYSASKTNEGLIFKTKNNESSIGYDELYKMWDEIRNQSVFSKGSHIEKKLFCELLLNLGYISNVRLLNPKTNDLVEGYY